MNDLPRIHPAPRQMGRLHGSAAVSSLQGLGVTIDQQVCPNPGGYRIVVSGEGNHSVSANDEDGAWSARSVLKQISGQYQTALPALVIEDWPAFRTRGLMLDISRDRIPTMDQFATLIELLSELRLNHLQLYVEHTFLYRGHESVCNGLDPLTAEQVRALDKQCRERGIELVANQNCFGHLSGWLRHPTYAHLAETHGEYEFYGIRRSGPFSLCPTDPRSLDLVRDWLSQLGSCFSSRSINIGCDETADIGVGRSAELVREVGKSAVYASFVSGVAEAAASLGLSPMFWADIALDSPGMLAVLPPDLLALAWGYEPDSPYEQWASAFRSHNRRFWVCPGTACWRSFTGRTHERRGALRAAANLANSAEGMLITAWGDLGHRQQWPITAYAIADAARAAWLGNDARFDAQGASRVSLGTEELGPWLDDLGDADEVIRRTGGIPMDGVETPIRNATALFETLHPARPGFVPRATGDEWQAVRDRLGMLERSQPENGTLVDEELRWTIDASLLACDVAIMRASGTPVERFDERMDRLISGHRSLWLERSRPGGLDSSCSYFDASRAEYGGVGA